MPSVGQFTASGICKYVADKENNVLAIASLISDTMAIEIALGFIPRRRTTPTPV